MRDTRRYWLFALLCYIAVFIYGFLLVHAAENRNRIVNELWDLGHVAAYFSLFFFVYKTSRFFNVLSWRMQLLVAACTAGIVGLIVEVIQRYTGRSFSWHDIYLNLVGTVTAVVLLSGWMKQQARKVSWSLRFLVLMLLSIVSLDAMVYTLDAVYARQQFPILLAPRYPFELTRLSGAKVKLSVQKFETNDVVAAEFLPARYSTLIFDHFPRDWSGYQQLKMEIYNDGDTPEELHVRLHDIDHFPDAAYTDRFNATYQLLPGWNSILISLEAVRMAPNSRKMNMHKIHQMMLYFYKLNKRRSLLIRQLRLEK